MDDLNISQYMYDWGRDLPPKIYKKISPSSIGGCQRKHWYSLKGAPITTPTNPGQILNMQTGFMWEKIITESLQHAQIPFISQWKMSSKKYNMEGTLDYGILRGGELEIWDSKTESSLAKKYRNGSYLNSHEEYVDQLNCYAYMAREAGFTVTRGGFVVVRRDDSFIENFPFVFDEIRIAKTMAKVAKLQKNLEDNTLPPCDGKYCQIGLCEYGNPETRKENAKGKLINSSCCGTPQEIKKWYEWRVENENTSVA